MNQRTRMGGGAGGVVAAGTSARRRFDDGEPTDAEVREIAEILHRAAGICLPPDKKHLVHTRLRRHLVEQGHESYAAYAKSVREDSSGDGLATLVDALTTNETRFFREMVHFDFLREEILAHARDPVKIWSAACSTGQEPYSLAMQALEFPPAAGAGAVQILATDVDRGVLEIARAGRYRQDAIDRGPRKILRHMRKVGEGRELRYEIARSARSLVHFARLNLMGKWPMRGPLDLILCRNVMIYFDAPTQAWLAWRMASLLRPGGHLFIGHSESLGLSAHGLETVQPAIYRRTEEPLPPPPRRPERIGTPR